MTQYLEEHETFLYRVRAELLERQLGRTIDAAAEERERLARELVALRRALAVARARQAAAPLARWVAIIAAFLAATSTSFLVARSGSRPAHTAPHEVVPAAVDEQPLPTRTSEQPAPQPGAFEPPAPVTPPAARPRPAEAQRARPAPGEIVDVLRAARARMRFCSPEEGRSARARVVFAGDDGRVISVTLTNTSDLGDSSAQQCVVRELRRARLEPFASATHSVTLPLAL